MIFYALLITCSGICGGHHRPWSPVTLYQTESECKVDAKLYDGRHESDGFENYSPADISGLASIREINPRDLHAKCVPLEIKGAGPAGEQQ